MKKALFAIAAAASLAGCAHTDQCVQPDPVEPAHSKCWDKGTDCGTGIQAFNGTAAASTTDAAAPATTVTTTKKVIIKKKTVTTTK